MLAFLIRLIALNQSLWLDEAVTAKAVREMGVLGILREFSPKDFHPPLYYLFVKLWTNFFGYSEIALRLPSVLFSLATGYVLYLIGGIWATTFFLFNPLIVYYSQEARMYMMATFFLTSALYFFLEKSKSLRTAVLAGLMISLAFLTFYGSAFLIVAMLIYWLYKKQYKIFFVSGLLFFLSLLVVSPLLYQQFLNARVNLTNVTNWTNVLGKANLKNLLLIPVKFSIGRIDFYPKWIYYAIAGLWTGLVWFFAVKAGLKNKLMFFLMISPVVTGLLFSFFTPLMQYFRFIYLIPLTAILLAKNKITMYRYIIATGFLTFSLIYLLLPQFHREDWKSLVKSLPKGKPVYMILSSSDPVKYYDKNLPIYELTNLQNIKNPDPDIIVIPYVAEIYGFDYQKILREKKYQLIDKRSFRGLVLEEYKL